MAVEIRLSAQVAESLAETAADVLRAASDIEPVRREPGMLKRYLDRDPTKAAELSLSSRRTRLGRMENAERAQLGLRVRQLLDRVGRSRGVATMKVGNRAIDLATVSGDEIISLLTAGR